MSTESSVIMVTMITLLAIAIPIIVLTMVSRKSKNLLKKAFDNAVASFALNISEKEEWNGRIIAVDDQTGKLVFMRRLNNLITQEIIDLHQVKSVSQEENENNDVELVLTTENGQKIRLMFYSGTEDNLSNEVIFKSKAIRWQTGVSVRLRAIAR